MENKKRMSVFEMMKISLITPAPIIFQKTLVPSEAESHLWPVPETN